MKDKEAVVLVHGIWMIGLELLYLRFKLWRQGYRVYQFHYSSLIKTPEQNSQYLYQFSSKVNEPVIHFVAHSLGGIVVSHMLKNHEIDKAGKVVLIGSPVNGSAVAKHLNKRFLFKYLLGKSNIKGLLGDGPRWLSKRPTCVIAGIKKLGVGMLLAGNKMQQQHDGTVNLSETEISQTDEVHVVPHSHFSMLWSFDVAEKIKKFLAA